MIKIGTLRFGARARRARQARARMERFWQATHRKAWPRIYPSYQDEYEGDHDYGPPYPEPTPAPSITKDEVLSQWRLNAGLPPAHGGCTCACHRRSGVMHIVQCCTPEPDRWGGGRFRLNFVPCSVAPPARPLGDIPSPLAIGDYVYDDHEKGDSPAWREIRKRQEDWVPKKPT